MYRLAHRLRIIATALLVAAGVLLAVRLTFASHNFSDVPTSAIYHNAVEWVFNRGITLGCTAGLYCPDDFVTRAQMALFMQRLGTAVTPVFIDREAQPGPLDFDASPRICATADFTPTFPMRAYVKAWVDFVAGLANARVFLSWSQDGGTSWTPMSGVFSRAGSAGVGEWTHGDDHAVLDLNTGIPYRFAVQINREGGTADATDSACHLTAMVVNRNPTSSPLSGPSRPQRGR